MGFSQENFFDNWALKQRPNSSFLFLSILSFLYTIINGFKTRQNPADSGFRLSLFSYYWLEIFNLIKIKNTSRSLT